MIELSRRDFAASLGLAVAGCSVIRPRAIEPFSRKGRPRLHLSLAAYSFRQYFKDGNREGGVPENKKIDLFQFIDYCAEQGCDAAEPTSYYFPENATPRFLLDLKRHAFLRGVALSGTAIGNTFTLPPGPDRQKQIDHAKKWIDHAALMGIPHIRVFAGNQEKQSLEQAMKHCIEALEECCDYAGRHGVFLGIENHGGIVAEAGALLEIVKAVKSPWVGINLDTGNFHTADPYADLARCAPFAVNVQVKTEIRPQGRKAEPADLPRIIRILRDANYQGYVVLEYEASEDPYTGVPRALGQLKALL